MDVAKGDNCSDFPAPKTRSPGRRSSAGTRRAAQRLLGYGGGDGYGDTTGGGYQGYDPRLYDEPPGRRL